MHRTFFFSIFLCFCAIDAFPLINFSSLKNYNPVSLAFKQIADNYHHASAHKKLFSVLPVETLPSDEQLLYERFFHLLSKAHTETIDSEEIEKTSFMKLLAEKMTIFVDEEGNMQSEAVILSDIAYRLDKLTLLQDDEIKKIINQFEDEKKKFRRFIKVIKHIYEEIGLPEIGIDRKKAMSIYSKIIKNPETAAQVNSIKMNPGLNELQKEHELHEFNNYLMVLAQQKSQVVDLRGWKSHIIKKTHYWQSVIDHKIYGKKINEIIQKDRKNRLREFEKENNEFRNKYILIERGDHIIEKFDNHLKERIADRIKLFKKNHPIILNEMMPGLESIKFFWDEENQWRKLEEIYDELDDSENRWRKLKLKYHPDKNNQTLDSEKFRHVIEAEENYNKLIKNYHFIEENRGITKEDLKAQWQYERLNAGQREVIDIYSEMLSIIDNKFHKDAKLNEWIQDRENIIRCIKNNFPIINPKLPTSMNFYESYQQEMANSMIRLLPIAIAYARGLPTQDFLKIEDSPKFNSNFNLVEFAEIRQIAQNVIDDNITQRKEIKAKTKKLKAMFEHILLLAKIRDEKIRAKDEEIRPVLEKMVKGYYDPKVRTTFGELLNIVQKINKSYEKQAIDEYESDKIRKEGIMLSAALKKSAEEREKFVKKITLTEMLTIVKKMNPQSSKEQELKPILQKMLTGVYNCDKMISYSNIRGIADNVNKSYEHQASVENARYKMRRKGIILADHLQNRAKKKNQFVHNLSITEIPSIIEKYAKQ